MGREGATLASLAWQCTMRPPISTHRSRGIAAATASSVSKESQSTSTLLDRLVGGGAHASVPEQIRVDECACDAIIAHGSFDHPDFPVRVHAHICGVLEFIEIDDATEAQPAPLSDHTELMQVSTSRAEPSIVTSRIRRAQRSRPT